jgi:peptidylprolyl isomerase
MPADALRWTKRTAATAAVAAVAAVAAIPWTLGCADSGDGATERTDTRTASEMREPSQYGFADEDTRPYAKPASRQPKVRIPSHPAPGRLTLEELRDGAGKKTVDFGDEAIVNYVGYIYATKRRYDTSYGDNPAPMKVVPGRRDFIEGFEQGLVGMRVGGRRKITIPPAKAYADRGFQEDVGPGDTLLFVVDLEALEKRHEAGD